ncbi:tRNA 2-selenouridine(34) synthase MnmH [Pseudaeromonas sp. ZJS20]|uniref:tRNA 2-selenouridine(34) synthase MnmH n=1 Tax=Pseudaeromonas aegiceratis TaxID=3153928 RepID=UPI00390C9627
MSLPTLAADADLLLSGRPLLDLRAPLEFADGAFPQAISLPLMNDAERAAVGTCYKRQGQAAAIALGHQLVSGDIRAARLDAWLSQIQRHPDTVLYCARGGLRSETVQQWLADADCVVPRVAGGYKALRRCLIDSLDRLSGQLPLRVLCGMTGSGKTELLVQLANGVDLEGLARHRGSSFGALPEGQPSNIDFENRLSLMLLRQQRAGVPYLLLEDESRMIGRCTLPMSLYQAMQQAPLVILEAPLAERIARIQRDYVDDLWARFARQTDADSAWQQLGEFLGHALQRLERRLGGLLCRQLQQSLQAALSAQQHTGDASGHARWIGRLLTEYYDPIYGRQLQGRPQPVLFRGDAEACLGFLRQSV